MPAEFQQATDRILHNIPGPFAFLDNILVCTEGRDTDHWPAVRSVLNRLNHANVGLNLEKCAFALPTVDWLGFRLSPEGATPLIHKLESIQNLKPPNTLKQLRGLMGAVHRLNKFIPNLAQLCTPFRPSLKSTEKLTWTPHIQKALDRLKQAVLNVVQNKFFDTHADTRITCDASKEGLGAVLEQRHKCTWVPIAFTSRFLNSAKAKYSINELELLAVIWSVEKLRLRTPFHRAHRSSRTAKRTKIQPW